MATRMPPCVAPIINPGRGELAGRLRSRFDLRDDRASTPARGPGGAPCIKIYPCQVRTRRHAGDVPKTPAHMLSHRFPHNLRLAHSLFPRLEQLPGLDSLCQERHSFTSRWLLHGRTMHASPSFPRHAHVSVPGCLCPRRHPLPGYRFLHRKNHACLATKGARSCPRGILVFLTPSRCYHGP